MDAPMFHLTQQVFAACIESERAMVSIRSNNTYNFIDVLRMIRSLVGELARIATNSGLDESRKLVRSLNALEKRTTHPQLKLAILGDSDAHKQSLMHELLRMSLQGLGLPQSESSCLYLAFGSEPECAITLTSGMTARLPLTELSDFVGSQASTSEIQKLLVRIPNEVLKAGVVVIETPALEKKANDLAPWTRTALEEADACLLVLDGCAVLDGCETISEHIALFLKKAEGQAHKFFVILDSARLGGESSLAWHIQEQFGIPEKRLLSMPLLKLSAEDDYSEKDPLESLRIELMQFARMSSHKAMAQELHRLARETLDQAERAASSARTFMLRMRLRSHVKAVAGICQRTEELLAQTHTELSKASGLRPTLPVNERALEQADSSIDNPLTEVQPPSVEHSTMIDLAVDAQSSMSLPNDESVVAASVPMWHHPLRRAASELEKGSSTALPRNLPSPAKEVSHAKSFIQQASTRDTSNSFVQQSFTSGIHLIAPFEKAEPALRTNNLTGQNGESRATAFKLPVGAEQISSPAKPAPPEDLSEVAVWRPESQDGSIRTITPLKEQLTSEIIPEPTPPVNVEERGSGHNAASPIASATSAESFSTRSYYSSVDGEDEDVADGRRHRLIRRVAATLAVVASAWAIMFGLQHLRPFEESGAMPAESVSASHAATNQAKMAVPGPVDKLPMKTGTPQEAPSPDIASTENNLGRNSKIDPAGDAGHASETVPGLIVAAPSSNNRSDVTDRTLKASDAEQPQPASPPNGRYAVPDPSLRAALDRWTDSYRSGNVQEQVSCYAPFVDTYFNLRNVRPEQVGLDRKNSWSKIARVDEYRVTPIRITDQGNGQQSVLLQKVWSTTTTRGTKFAGSDLEKLVFVKIDNAWKIVDEQEVKVLKGKRS